LAKDRINKIRIIDLKTTETDQVIRVEVSYKEGGQNSFSGSMMKRGIYISAQPTTIKDGMSTYNPRLGARGCVQELPRYNYNKLYAVSVLAKTLQSYKQVIQVALDQSGWILTESLEEVGEPI